VKFKPFLSFVCLLAIAFAAASLQAAPKKKSKKEAAVAPAQPVTHVDLTCGWRMQPFSSKQLARDKFPRNEFPVAKEDPKTVDQKSLDELLDDADFMSELDPYAASKPKPKKNKETMFTSRDGRATYWLPKPLDLGAGFLPQLADDVYKTDDYEKNPNRAWRSNYNVWMEKKIVIPADWKDKWVLLEGDIGFIDLAVFANGKRVATLSPPDFAVDVSGLFESGATNEVRIFASSQGYGGLPGISYRARDELISGAQQFFQPLRLVTHATPILLDVWADTSWRKKSAAFRCEVRSPKTQKVRIVTTVYEDAGRDPKTRELLGTKVAKKLERTFTVTNGVNEVALEMPWPDAHLWELADPFLYNCETEMFLEDGTKCESKCDKFVFGFREVWREGKNFMLNGHVQHYRGSWGGTPATWEEYKKYGFNAVYCTMQHQSRFWNDKGGPNDGSLLNQLEDMARAGVVLMGATPSASFCVGSLKNNKAQQAMYARYLKRWAKSVRNWPNLHSAAVCVNTMCAAAWTMGARDFGRHRTGTPESDGIYGGIGTACAMAQSVHPNCLYFAHGDGNAYDVATCNFYFNWIPLQEREEWLSCWSSYGENLGEIPNWAAEFGGPYYGSWFPGNTHAQQMTELSAIYLGKEAYALEDRKLLQLSRDFSYSSLGNFYGGWATDPETGTGYMLFDLCEAGQKTHGLIIERLNRTWRIWGQAVRPTYLDAMDWANGGTNGYELVYHKRYNGLCVAFIGDAGKGAFAGKTHAWYAGDTVKKAFPTCWDGVGTNRFTATWKVTEKTTGRVIAKGVEKYDCPPGESVFPEMSFKAPSTAKRLDLVLDVVFDARDIDDTTRTDSFDLEIHPPLAPVAVPAGKSVALWDPRGDSAAVLKKLGVAYEAAPTLDALVASKATHLVIGRRALDGVAASNHLERLAPRVLAGTRVMILSQQASAWQKMGLIVEDCAPRTLWNEELPGIDSKDLAFWRGYPLPLRDGGGWKWGEHWGLIQEQANGSRMWRWTHTQAVALEVFMIPQRSFLRPLAIGELDLMYAPVLRGTIGNGSLMLCSLDFEGPRFGDDPSLACPAAQATGRSVVSAFLNDDSVLDKTLYAGDEAAERLAKTLGYEPKAWTGAKIENGVLLLSSDSSVSGDELRGALGKGAHAFLSHAHDTVENLGLATYWPQIRTYARIAHYKKYFDPKKVKRAKAQDMAVDSFDDVANPDLAITLEEKKDDEANLPILRKGEDPEIEYWEVKTNFVKEAWYSSSNWTNWAAFPYKGVGPQHLRWRWANTVPRIKDGQKGWKTTGDGVMAVSDDGKILVDQLDTFGETDHKMQNNKGDIAGISNAALSQNQQLRRFGLVLQNWGVRPGAAQLERVLTIPAPVAKGEKGPEMANLYYNVSPGTDGYWFCLW